MEQKRKSVESELFDKDRELKAAFDKKEFQKVATIRDDMTRKRKELIELQKKDQECKDACKPDAMKQDECDKIRIEIAKLEETATDADTEKIDTLYKDLVRCNKQLRELKGGE